MQPTSAAPAPRSPRNEAPAESRQETPASPSARAAQRRMTMLPEEAFASVRIRIRSDEAPTNGALTDDTRGPGRG